MISVDQLPIKPTWAEQKRLECVESLYELIDVTTEETVKIRHKFFMHRDAKDHKISAQHRRIEALALAINLLGKIRLKEDVYPFEM